MKPRPCGSGAPEHTTVGIVLAALSLAVMPLLGWGKLRTARALGSQALEADSKETFVCAYLSLALLLGLALNALLGWWWADPVAALAMLPLIVREGWGPLKPAAARMTTNANGGQAWRAVHCGRRTWSQSP
jgi:divalent metal cation (Fe/Co/Zn/Cd) transporter